MKRRLRVGIAGCGAIGTSLALKIASGSFPELVLSCLFDADRGKTEKLVHRLKKRIPTVETLEGLVKRCDILVEAASASASFVIAAAGLRAGRDVVVMSVAGVAEKIGVLKRIAKKGTGRLYIPSGAIAGIDGVKGACQGTVKSVTLTTVKPPLAFKGVAYLKEHGLDPDSIVSRKTLFSGKAMEAVKLFPQNINVAAVLSIAGIGALNTRVTIVADPECRSNSHTITVKAASGTITATTENEAHPDNPKTSYLAVLAALATLKQIGEPVRIGT